MPLFGYTNATKSFCQPILKGNIKGAMKGEIEAFKMTIWGDMVVAIATVGYSFNPKGKAVPMCFHQTQYTLCKRKRNKQRMLAAFNKTSIKI